MNAQHSSDAAPAVAPVSVRNPRTGESDYQFVAPSAAEVALLTAELREGQRYWNGLGVQGRASVLRCWADEIDAYAARIGAAESLDTGRWRVSHEVPAMVANSIRGWCDRAPGIFEAAALTGTSSTSSTVTYRTQLDPYPLLGVMSPWNHPFLLATLDAIPALLAGCAVIIKPSEITPRFIEPVNASIREIPHLWSVLRLVAGDGSVGQAILDNVDALCFTGSVATGRKIAVRCAERFIPAFLELGGKDAVIVTESADVDRAAVAVLKGAVQNTGQLCFSTERIYVDRAIHNEFVDNMVARANELQLNFPDIRRGHLGPFISGSQADVVDSQVDDALKKGAILRAGGPSETLGGGRYMRATLLTDVSHDMAIMRQETFGPVAPIMAFDSVDEAVSLANDSDFGLSGAVIAGDATEAAAVAARLHAGAISLQDTSLNVNIMQDAEKMAYRQSGLGGSRMGPASLLRFLRKKALVERAGPAVDMQALREDG
jgi:succinate-semialdehyde dehydrogenase / glutarate-semialdehyde dehydrogenase